jgi:hypothetical protein
MDRGDGELGDNNRPIWDVQGLQSMATEKPKAVIQRKSSSEWGVNIKIYHAS